MFDTMTFTKITGAFCGAFLVFLLAKWAADGLYPTHVASHGDDHGQAYVIDTGEEDEGVADIVEEEAIDFATLIASADIGKGERVFGKCKACHKLDGTDGVGPHLNGVVDRPIGVVDGFAYSNDLATKGGAWDTDNLVAFLTNPKAYASGTKMNFAGLKKPEDIANVIAYLEATAG